jgi:hypothetical protein
MLKKISWIVALFAALTMAFVGCSNFGELDDDSGPKVDTNPIVDGAKYLEIAKRVNGWDSIDIRAGKAGVLDQWTADVDHTVTVYGKTVSGTKNIYLGNTDSDYSTNWGWISGTEADGSFKIEAKLPWSAISNPANNKRISVPTPPTSVIIYEIVINDGVKDIYKLSEDVDVQDAENGALLFPDDKTPTTWLIRAGGPQVKVIEPGAGEGLSSTYVIPQSDDEHVSYIDLNNYTTRGTKEVAPNDLVAGALVYTPGTPSPTRNDLTLTFAKQNQRVHFKLTASQINKLNNEADKVNVKITTSGTTTVGAAFKYYFSDPSAKEKFKGTTEGTALNTAIPLTFTADKSAKTLAYFTIELTSVPTTPVTVRIDEIEIEGIMKTFTGTLAIENLSGNTGGTDGSIVFATYHGPEAGISYEWTQGSKVFGTGPSVYISNTKYASYKVTMSAFGYYPQEEEFDLYSKTLDVLFSGTAGANQVVATGLTVKGSPAGLAMKEDPDNSGTLIADSDRTAATVAATTDGDGFTFTYGTSGYQDAYAVFQVNFSGVDFKRFSQVTFTFLGDSGDIGWKPVTFLASATAIQGWNGNGEYLGTTSVDAATRLGGVDTGYNGVAAKELTIDIADNQLTNTLYFSIFASCGGTNATRTTKYTITGIKFH